MSDAAHGLPAAHDVVVIGGGGHVGLPLAIALADSGASVAV
jgi:UDP-N-acetyl-D-mannosaminuronic acid dehydrogenase